MHTPYQKFKYNRKRALECNVTIDYYLFETPFNRASTLC